MIHKQNTSQPSHRTRQDSPSPRAGERRVQLRAASYAEGVAMLSPRSVHNEAAAGVAGASAPLPFLDRIQASFGGHDVTGVQSQTGGRAAEACQNISANAYATGSQVAFGGAPTLHTAAHEAAHVVQQRSGVQLAGGVGTTGDAYEVHADAVADCVVRGQSAEILLDRMAGQAHETTGVQRQVVQRDPPTAETLANVAQVNIQLRTARETILAIAVRHPSYAAQLASEASRLSQFNTLLTRLGQAGTVVVGLSRMANALTADDFATGAGEFLAAAADTGVHLAAGSNPITAVVDGILTAVFGPSWPSDCAAGVVGVISDAIALQDELSTWFPVGLEVIGNMMNGQPAIRSSNSDVLCELGDTDWCL